MLLSVAERIPEVGYCQGMNFIAAVGLDTGLEEESVCELIVSFAQTVADGYWTESLEGVCTDQLILEHLARTDLSSLCSHLDDMAVPLVSLSLSHTRTSLELTGSNRIEFGEDSSRPVFRTYTLLPCSIGAVGDVALQAVFSGPWLLQLYTNVLPRNVLELVWDILVLCRGTRNLVFPATKLS